MSQAAFLQSAASNADPAEVSQIAEEIAAVEEELRQRLCSEVKLVSEIGAHVLEGGGKRLRPALLVLSAKATGLAFDVRRAHRLAACMEMIHMATLIHDDVIDKAERRRGRSTASAVFGNTASILAGDVLLAKAMSILATDGDLEIIRSVSSAVVELAEGEVAELEQRDKFDLDLQSHIGVLHKKTASFIQCCCEVGGRVAGAPNHVREALVAYGRHIGLAFQLVDDLLDYRGDKRATGKSKGTDFREGCATLPLIYLRETLNETESATTRLLFGNGASDEDIHRIRDWMEQRGAFRRTEELAADHVESAKVQLRALPPNESVSLLEAAADFVLLRTA